MSFFKVLLSTIALSALVGCSSGLEVIKKPNPGEKLAILMFADCNQYVDCPGSGKKVADIYSQVFGAPVVMFEEDAKKYDLLLTGKLLNYNEALPAAGNVNVVHVDLRLKRVADNSVLIKQNKQAVGTNLFSSTKGLTKDLANSLKEQFN